MDKKIRNSAFELLRILSILMIIFHHYYVHGVINIDSSNLYYFPTVILGSFGKLGVALFITISAYFLCKQSFSIKRLVLLLLEVEFYSVVIYLIFIISGKNEFNFKWFMEEFLPLLYNEYWFISCYVIIYLAFPFLNIIVNNISQKQLRNIIITSLVIYSLLITIFNRSIINGSDHAAFYYNDLIMFFIYYFIGSYIRNYGLKLSKKQDILGIVISLGLLIGSIVFLTYFGINGKYNNNINFLMVYPNHFTQINSPLVVVITICSIDLISKVKPFFSKFLNYIAKSTLAVYLIHDNNYVRNVLWNNILHVNDHLSLQPIVYFTHMFVSVLIIFVVSIIIDILRRIILEKPMLRVYDYLKIKYSSDWYKGTQEIEEEKNEVK